MPTGSSSMPNPQDRPQATGSREAWAKGCLCPVLDNEDMQCVRNAEGELRGISSEDLCLDYAKRGLRSDLVRFACSEGKPSRRPLPVKVLEGHEDE